MVINIEVGNEIFNGKFRKKSVGLLKRGLNFFNSVLIAGEPIKYFSGGCHTGKERK